MVSNFLSSCVTLSKPNIKELRFSHWCLNRKAAALSCAKLIGKMPKLAWNPPTSRQLGQVMAMECQVKNYVVAPWS